jgi:hypothetical protein
MLCALLLVQATREKQETEVLQGSKMTNQTELRHTEFNVTPLRNVVGVGNVTAYQICVTRGSVIATLGTIEEFIEDSPLNASRYDDNNPEPASELARRHWFRSVITG